MEPALPYKIALKFLTFHVVISFVHIFADLVLNLHILLLDLA